MVGGSLTGAYVGKLLGAPVGRWADALAFPLLVALGSGKLAMALGGSGQDSPLDAVWSTAYLVQVPGAPRPRTSFAPGAALRGDRDAVLVMLLVLGGVG